jgi:hypothetical protein
MGESGYRRLLSYRNEELIPAFTKDITSFLQLSSETILSSPRNTISYAVSLRSTASSDLPFFGSMLFQRNISGCRVITNVNKTTGTHSLTYSLTHLTTYSLTHSVINGYSFINWGSHHSAYPASYFTVAVTIGMTRDDVGTFVTSLNKTYQKYQRKVTSATPPTAQEAEKEASNSI